jgi:hypothetical protein
METRTHSGENNVFCCFCIKLPTPPLAILTASFRLSSLSSFCVAGRRFACISYIIAAMSIGGADSDDKKLSLPNYLVPCRWGDINILELELTMSWQTVDSLGSIST